MYFLNKLKSILFYRPQRVIGWLIILVFGYLIIIPLLEMIFNTFIVQEGDVLRVGAEVGEFSSFYWQRMLASDFARKLFYEPLINTFVISITYSALAMSLGLALAWLLVKSDMPFKSIIGSIAIIPYILPSWSLAMSWLIAFRNDRIGVGAPGLVQAVLGITPPDWLAYGPIPIIIVLTLHCFAFTYLLASAALSSINASLEETALIKGAQDIEQIRKITLPLILPALSAAFLLTFARGLGNFGVSAVLGLPARYYVLSTTLFQSVKIGRLSDGYVIAIFLIAVSAVIMYGNNILIGKRRQFTTITGKGGRIRITSLGSWRYPVAYAVLIFFFFAGIVPILLLLWQSLHLRLEDFSFNLNLTYWLGHIDGFDGILIDNRVHLAAWNTLRLAVFVGFITAFIGIVVGYLVTKERGTKLSKLIDQISFLPYLMPPMAFGLVYLSMWAKPRGPLPVLYGTFALLLLAVSVSRLPFATRAGISTMSQVGNSLEEAGEVSGAGLISRFTKILLPLSKKGFMAGFILTFVSAAKDLDLVILLMVPHTIVLTTLSYSYNELGRLQFSYALAVVVIFISLLGTWLVRRLTKIDPFRGFGGIS